MNNIAGKTDITDDELKGNERIEEAISSLQKEPSQEMLAHTLTVIYLSPFCCVLHNNLSDN